MILKNIKLIAVFMLVGTLTFFTSCDSKTGSNEEEVSMGDSTALESQNSNSETNDVVNEAPVDQENASIASPRKDSKGAIESVNTTIDYGSPGVKGRKVWGGLEEYGVVWRAGANETTSIEFSDDVLVGNKKVPAGKYGLYMIPNENAEWIVIINSDWNREEHGAWGAYNYNEKHDIARINVMPEWVEENQERLKYEIVEDGISFAWEKAHFTIPVSKAGAE